MTSTVLSSLFALVMAIPPASGNSIHSAQVTVKATAIADHPAIAQIASAQSKKSKKEDDDPIVPPN